MAGLHPGPARTAAGRRAGILRCAAGERGRAGQTAVAIGGVRGSGSSQAASCMCHVMGVLSVAFFLRPKGTPARKGPFLSEPLIALTQHVPQRWQNSGEALCPPACLQPGARSFPRVLLASSRVLFCPETPGFCYLAAGTLTLATGFTFPVQPGELHPRPQGQPPRVQGGRCERLGSVPGLPATKPRPVQSPSQPPPAGF